MPRAAIPPCPPAHRGAAPALLALALALAALAGCGGLIARQAANTTYGVLEKSTVAAQRQSDLELARAALPGGIVQLEAFSLAYPHHRGFRDMHADAHCQYAVAFVFDDWEDAALGGPARADEAARIAARLRPLLARCVELNAARLPAAWRAAATERGAALAALLPAAKTEDAPALLWIATSDAVQIAIDPRGNFGRLPLTEAVLARCTQLRPGLRDAGGELLLATLEAGRGAALGGGDGQAAFDRARSLAGEGALTVDVMYARGTAVARRDRALFTATLERVLAADPARWPERRLANELARHKARRYLAAAATLFPEPAAPAAPPAP